LSLWITPNYWGIRHQNERMFRSLSWTGPGRRPVDRVAVCLSTVGVMCSKIATTHTATLQRKRKEKKKAGSRRPEVARCRRSHSSDRKRGIITERDMKMKVTCIQNLVGKPPPRVDFCSSNIFFPCLSIHICTWRLLQPVKIKRQPRSCTHRRRLLDGWRGSRPDRHVSVAAVVP
jgi:hypothetical protein